MGRFAKRTCQLSSASNERVIDIEDWIVKMSRISITVESTCG